LCMFVSFPVHEVPSCTGNDTNTHTQQVGICRHNTNTFISTSTVEPYL